MQDKFIVPQFIDSEDKIWGPITVRQFILVIVGGLFIFLAYKFSDFTLFLLQTISIAIFVGLFAFYRVNGAPFHLFAINVIQTYKKPKIRVWLKEYIRIEQIKSKEEGKVEKIIPRRPFIAQSKLSELSLIIDTGGIYKGEQRANGLNNVEVKK
ncbi:PrgI family protein [Candidatus Parcubacteria bacterium]|jgi:hypothetical protein|nr:PrgI family protein [Candidatus Parcubacteria bacterium]MBT7228463.1 PrgI family protein [Candidatus Parcubacteria bacterium]